MKYIYNIDQANTFLFEIRIFIAREANNQIDKSINIYK